MRVHATITAAEEANRRFLNSIPGRPISSALLETPGSRCATTDTLLPRQQPGRSTGECLDPPLNTTVAGKKEGVKLRGRDAVFWPSNSPLRTLVDTDDTRDMFPFDRDVSYEDDYDIAHKNFDSLHEKAEPQQIPLDQRDQTLYHWTDQFPSSRHVPDGATVTTYGFVWTSTAKEFIWKGQQRVKIVLPKGKEVSAFVDPSSHSRHINCDGETTDEPSATHHNDVVLQPSVFKLLRREVDLELVDSVLAKSMAASSGNITSVERLENGKGWHVHCKQVGLALEHLYRNRDDVSRETPWKWVLYGSAELVPVQPGLLFVNAEKLIRSPVLEWSEPSKLAPSYSE